MPNHSYIAGGNIPPCRFVTATTPNRTVVVSATTDKPIGVSPKHTHAPPFSIGGSTVDDGYAGIAGMSMAVHDDPGEEALLEITGTVAFGDFLKPDGGTAGQAITASSDGDFYGARALESGVSGKLIRVKIEFGFRGA